MIVLTAKKSTHPKNIAKITPRINRPFIVISFSSLALAVVVDTDTVVALLDTDTVVALLDTVMVVALVDPDTLVAAIPVTSENKIICFICKKYYANLYIFYIFQFYNSYWSSIQSVFQYEPYKKSDTRC